ncbi:DNA-(apurinic or apyrimidinic site) lyase [Flavimobilis soli]|uniref:DNA-(Apurinic or apyrimidinic site) lyase n=1 Tax=Flavimobilis soli TaxID=442709 RepID=A0A2A9EFT4_9MICO|nr:bifunctional DNA-formamidopyrimidine glycosylase/DNA-(apurinic or apyrimidinic site) lyase [Flavimobilis soli]PFG37794.1 DNA-(apurinic or apyrimidinic site) lyase [Flavimobilis soli]
MPELPEVETVRDGVARHVVGGRVTDVQVFRDYSVRRHVGGPVDLAARLDGARLDAAVRRGKYLWVPLSTGTAPTGEALLVHLGMSGQLLVSHADDDAPAHRHLRVRMRVEMPDGAARHLDFVDQRTFGHLAVEELVPTPDGRPGGLGTDVAALPRSVAHVGRDLLDLSLDDRDLAALVAQVRRRASGIKRILLDQTLTSGVGNIYADEALWRARVHPERRGDALRPVQVRSVLDSARAVMTAALRAGGTSFDSLYVNVNGESGYFSRSLEAYGRAGQPCSRCGTPIERMSFMNRSSHVCPRCQPRPRGVRPS